MSPLPGVLAHWCCEVLGSPVVGQLFDRQQAAQVYALELADGRTVVVKSRRDTERRAAACVAAQTALAGRGFACARPLTGVFCVDGLAVHAEEYLPGGEILTDDGPGAGSASGTAYADVLGLLAELSPAPPPTNPDWVRWTEPELFPQLWWQEPWVTSAPLPPVVLETAERVRHRLASMCLDPALGHADWETQNLRWIGGRLFAVHDWDSLAHLPECALVGAAAGAFASNCVPTLAPIDSSAAFLDGYQRRRGRWFSPEEIEYAWAASLWPACYNARNQVMFDLPPAALDQLVAQAASRLDLAGA